MQRFPDTRSVESTKAWTDLVHQWSKGRDSTPPKIADAITHNATQIEPRSI